MDDFQREKSILSKLVKAREAIKQKYNLLKFQKADAEKKISDTFKPLIDPLQKISTHYTIAKTEKPSEKKFKLEKIKREKIKHEPSAILSQSDDDYDTAPGDEESDSENADKTIQHIGDIDDDDFYLAKVKSKDKKFLDLVYGVRWENGLYKIGNSNISFENNQIAVNNLNIPKSSGLMELLIKKQPNYKVVDLSLIHI